jgi:hypothetical protein
MRRRARKSVEGWRPLWRRAEEAGRRAQLAGHHIKGPRRSGSSSAEGGGGAKGNGDAVAAAAWRAVAAAAARRTLTPSENGLK